MFAILFALPGLAYWKLGLNEILAFWTAYVLTRPLGASFADWLAVSHARGGLGWGTVPVSLGLSVLIVGFVIYISVNQREQTHELGANH